MLRRALIAMGLLLTSQVSAAAETITTAPAPANSKPTVPERLPVLAFAQLPFIEQAQISPDGERMAGLIAVNGQQQIAIFSLFDKSEKLVRGTVPENTELSWVRWVNNDNLVIRLKALVVVEGERWYFSRLVSMNRLTGKFTKLLWEMGGQTADLVWVPSDGSNEVLIAAQNSVFFGDEFWPVVFQVNVETGSRRKVKTGAEGVMDWFADGEGIVRAGISYRDLDRSYKLIYRSSTNQAMRTIDRADGRSQELLINPFLFLPNTDLALTIHENDQGRAAIYETDLATLKDTRTIFEPREGEVASTIVSADGKKLLGVKTTRALNGTVWFDKDLATLQEQFTQAVPDAKLEIISMSQDRRTMLVAKSAPDTPGQIYHYDVNIGKLKRVSDLNSHIGSRRLAPVKLIRYKARDGLEIEAILTLPVGRSARPLPLIMMPHGGPWDADELRYDYWAQFLANRGYAVLQPNFRGSTGYGTDFRRKGEGQMGLAMQDDLSDGVSWAAKEGIVDPGRVCIMGASYGGYAAMWGIVKDPDLYRCAISIAGVSSLRREVSAFSNRLMAGKFRDDWARMTPDFSTVSPLNAVDRIKVPLMLIHGKKDLTVDYSQSSSMYDRMKSAGKAVELVPLPRADHCFTRQEDRIALLTSIERFLAQHNPAH